MLALETGNRQACELVANAIGAIDAYKLTRARDLLEHALADLKLARHHDGHFLLAPYYIAVIEDLLGRSRDAAEQLQIILSEAPTGRPDLINEMRFNLAVAQYHGYSHEHLQGAAATLEKILNETGSLFGRIRFFRVRLHSRALLARVNAMWSIPRSPEDATAQAERDRIRGCYKTAVRNVHAVVHSPMLNMLRITERNRASEIEAITRNALGTAEMYYTDYFLDNADKLRALRRGLEQLIISDQLFSRDWSTYCNIGSCHMRLAYWGKDATEFRLTRDFLNEVVRELRPNYGFALYEIGRSYRIEGNFDEATKYLTQAKEIPVRYREVSDRRIDRELGLAKKGSSLYP